MEVNRDTYVVKQFMSLLLTMMTSYAIVAVLASVYFTQTLSGYWYGLFALLFMILLGVGCFWFLKTKGKQLFEEL